MDPKVARKIDELKNDRIHGASWLAQQAISTLSFAVEQSSARAITQFMEEIKAVARELRQAKPSMIPIANYTDQFLQQVMAKSRHEDNLDSLKSYARGVGKELNKSAAKALSKAVEYGCGIINDLDTVITCSYSSTVCDLLRLAWRRETEFQVIVAESRFEDKTYGQITAKELRKCGIPVEIIPDSSIGLRLPQANKALVGADSITVDGYLINGKPTLLLAETARESKIPLYVICETAKFDISSYTATFIEAEPGFDKTPLELVTGIITEKGTMQPSLVIAYIEQMAQLPQR